MITRIREVRKAKRLTLEEVAARCDPPTTAQTVQRMTLPTRRVALCLKASAMPTPVMTPTAIQMNRDMIR